MRHGLIFVWGEGGSEAFIHSAANPPRIVPQLEAQETDAEPEKLLTLSKWFMRDAPYGVEVLFENLLDPTHLPFSHHGYETMNPEPKYTPNPGPETSDQKP